MFTCSGKIPETNKIGFGAQAEEETENESKQQDNPGARTQINFPEQMRSHCEWENTE